MLCHQVWNFSNLMKCSRNQDCSQFTKLCRACCVTAQTTQPKFRAFTLKFLVCSFQKGHTDFSVGPSVFLKDKWTFTRWYLGSEDRGTEDSMIQKGWPKWAVMMSGLTFGDLPPFGLGYHPRQCSKGMKTKGQTSKMFNWRVASRDLSCCCSFIRIVWVARKENKQELFCSGNGDSSKSPAATG